MPAPSAPVLAFDEASGRLLEHRRGELTFFLPWPTLGAFTRGEDGRRWRAAQPHINFRVARIHAPVQQYLDRVPQEVLDAVLPFPDRQWELLVFASRCGDAAVDLLRANPTVGYMLANNWKFRREPTADPMVSASLLLRPNLKQRDVLRWLGFPDTESMRRIARKIDVAALEIPQLRGLRTAMTDAGNRKRLAHLPRITKPVLRLAADGALTCLAPGYLREITELRPRAAAEATRMIADTVRMWRLARPTTSLHVFVSTAQVIGLHDHLAATVDWHAISGPQSDLPRPPLKGTSTIIPIESVAMLADEGRQERNCVGSYASRVKQRRLFLYRVLAPTRATLSIIRRSGAWTIDRLLGAGNQPVPSATRRVVETWLKGAALAEPAPDAHATVAVKATLPNQDASSVNARAGCCTVA